MRSFIVCTFVALLSGALAAPEGNAKWEAFKAKHGKQHPAHEDAERMQRFLERDAEIEAHNARYAAGLESFSRQHTHYSDFSDEELDKSAFGLSVPMNISEPPLSDAPLMASTVREFDWRYYNILTPVKAQLGCSSCYAFAVVGAIEAMLKRKLNYTADLSEQEIVDCSYKIYNGENSGCIGGWPDAVFKYINDSDIVYEQSYEYVSGRTQQRGNCRYPEPPYRLFNGNLKMERIMPRNEDELANLLMTKGPLVITMAADREFKKLFVDLGDGVFDMDHLSTVEVNHAVVLVGFGVSPDNKPYWVIRNSWGPNWAVGGYGKIARGKNMCNIMKHGTWAVDY